MTSSRLDGKVIAVTGAFGALGRVVCETLVAAGAKVAALDMSQPQGLSGSEARLLLGGVDIGNAEAAAQAMAKAVSSLGRLDGLVNIAGGFTWQGLGGNAADTLATWDRMYQVNLRTAVSASTAALPHLLNARGGRIVNVGAAAATSAAAGMGPYTAAKAGVARLTEAMSEEYKDKGINVNAVLPSIIDTPANRKDMPDADHTRWVSPQDLAQVVLFLLSAESAAITGALIPVKGRV
jgi:NAD(P)-dependent dehydrogenase (short-subunit alcohol dehydrogenase family)